jgi:uncharacterized phage protein (TIGR02216 family)
VKRVAWARLMRFGMRELRLAPEVFWDLTPAELMLLAGDGAGAEPLTRAGLAELLARFPDVGRESGLE